jgi:hypothetical protein
MLKITLNISLAITRDDLVILTVLAKKETDIVKNTVSVILIVSNIG